LAAEVSYCVVNTQQRELLVRCLDAIAAERETLDFECEVLVLDNASTDGSVGAARRHPTVTEVVALDQRRGKGENDSHLLQRSRGRFC
jgi:N-acetylglucosaminyl-diphospho-decaprenol L-rhamnosyltransferase